MAICSSVYAVEVSGAQGCVWPVAEHIQIYCHKRWSSPFKQKTSALLIHSGDFTAILGHDDSPASIACLSLKLVWQAAADYIGKLLPLAAGTPVLLPELRDSPVTPRQSYKHCWFIPANPAPDLVLHSHSCTVFPWLKCTESGKVLGCSVMSLILSSFHKGWILAFHKRMTGSQAGTENSFVR